MFSKSLNILALAVLFVIVHQSQTQSTTITTITTTEEPTTNGTTTETPTTDRSTTTVAITTATTEGGTTTTEAPSNSCQPLTNCSQSDPPVCGRLPTAICRRFRNICDLQESNCAAQNNPLNTWTIVQMPSCSDLAIGGTGLCSTGAPEPRPECPSGPLVCPTGGNKVCAISRNGQQCRMLLNDCALRNLNCQTEPRNNWLATSRSRCRNMCPGNEPERCTTNRFKILLTIDDEDSTAV